MGKYKDVEVFGPSKESAKLFLLYLWSILICCITADIAFGLSDYLKTGEPIFNLAEYAYRGILWAFITIGYFIARWLAYRTKIFPKFKIREGLHFVVFLILLIPSFVLSGIILWQL